MIGKIKGIVDSVSQTSAIIDVNGVGYLVFLTSKTITNINIGDKVSLYIHTHVREDQITLFGFLDESEKSCYLSLISVNGVGSKVALAILSSLLPIDIQASVINQDKTIMTSISGIGPRLAERIIVELKGKALMPEITNSSIETSNNIDNNNLVQDATSALVNLGINKNEAYKRILKLVQNNPDITIDTLITMALQEGGK